MREHTYIIIRLTTLNCDSGVDNLLQHLCCVWDGLLVRNMEQEQFKMYINQYH